MSLAFGDAFAVQRDTFSGNDFPISAGDGVSISGHDLSDFVVLPGFVDVHVHLREPGFSYKETIRTGSLAAARGYADGLDVPGWANDRKDYNDFVRRIPALVAVYKAEGYNYAPYLFEGIE